MKKAKVVRKTFKQRLFEAEQAGIQRGHNAAWSDAIISARAEFLPPRECREGILTFARAVESWPVNGDALVAIVATDLKHVCNLAVPARTMQAIAAEMKKRLA